MLCNYVNGGSTGNMAMVTLDWVVLMVMVALEQAATMKIVKDWVRWW